jgi:hypothetical protein
VLVPTKDHQQADLHTFRGDGALSAQSTGCCMGEIRVGALTGMAGKRMLPTSTK